jgi:CCR4-NOT transcription complex subunit 9
LRPESSGSGCADGCSPDQSLSQFSDRLLSSSAGMASGLISAPKPLSYMQQQQQQHYMNPYTQQVQRGISAYSDTPPIVHPAPQFSLGGTASAMGGAGLINNGIGAGGMSVHENTKIYSLVIDLMSHETRETALLELSKKREQYDDLALVLWHSFGELGMACSSCGNAILT